MKFPFKTKRQKTIIALIIFFIIFDVFVSGFMKFGYYIVKCGGVPVAVNPSAFSIGQSKYLLPGNYTPGGAHEVYFCSENQAKAAGFEKDMINN
jgi:hypothetical protein